MDEASTSPAAAPSATQAILRRLRERFGQSELARKTGIPQPRLSRWESGDVPVAADDALKLQEFERMLAAAGDQAATDSEPREKAA